MKQNCIRWHQRILLSIKRTLWKKSYFRSNSIWIQFLQNNRRCLLSSMKNLHLGNGSAYVTFIISINYFWKKILILYSFHSKFNKIPNIKKRTGYFCWNPLYLFITYIFIYKFFKFRNEYIFMYYGSQKIKRQ